MKFSRIQQIKIRFIKIQILHGRPSRIHHFSDSQRRHKSVPNIYNARSATNRSFAFADKSPKNSDVQTKSQILHSAKKKKIIKQTTRPSEQPIYLYTDASLK